MKLKKQEKEAIRKFQIAGGKARAKNVDMVELGRKGGQARWDKKKKNDANSK